MVTNLGMNTLRGVIEASTIEEAVSLVSQTPCAVVHGVAQAWPLKSTP
jgi:hypothetical protein